MSWSFGEIRALATKAAKGAGLHWGLAEEAGFAVEWLEKRGFEGVQALAIYLGAIEENGNYEAANCPIAVGAWISDMCDTPTLRSPTVFQPVLLAPFVSSIVAQRAVRISSNSTTVLLNADSIDVVGKANFEDSELKHFTIEPVETQPLPSVYFRRVHEDRVHWVEILNRFAENTYAPETEESQQKGAGADSSDNE